VRGAPPEGGAFFFAQIRKSSIPPGTQRAPESPQMTIRAAAQPTGIKNTHLHSIDSLAADRRGNTPIAPI